MPTKSFLRSKTLWGLLLALVLAGARWCGVEINPSDPQTSAAVNEVLSIGGILFAGYGRMTAAQGLHIVAPGTLPADVPGNPTPAPKPRVLPLAIAAFALLGLIGAPLSFTGCQTNADGTKSLTPEGKQVLTVAGEIILNSALAAGESAAAQYASGGKVDGRQVAAASLSGINIQVRSLEGTPDAASPQALSTAISQGASNPAIARSLAPVVVNSVQTAIQNGVPPSTAIEKAAVQIDTAAAKLAPPIQAASIAAPATPAPAKASATQP